MITNNMNKINETTSEDLKQYIVDMIMSGMKPKEIIKKIEEDDKEVGHISNLYKYIDNLRRRNKKNLLAGEKKDTRTGEIDPVELAEIESYITQIYEDLRLKGIIGTKAITEIKKKVKAEYDETMDSSDVIEILKRAKNRREGNEAEQEAVEDLNENIEDVKKYTVDNGEYVFHIKKHNEFGESYFMEVRLPVKLVDGLFYDFSKFGKNMSGTEILQKYRLKPEVFAALKSRLGLYKASNVISPYTLENSTEGELETKIDQGVARHIRDKYKEKFVRSYNKVFETQAKKALKMVGNVEDVIELVREGIADMEPISVNRKNINKLPYNSDIAIFVSSDYHFGEDDDRILEARLDEMVDEMINTTEHNINWISLGDLAETFLEEGMHAGQTNRMKLHGFDLVKYIYQVFASRMLRLVEAGKHLTVDWQGGNHDRMGKTNDMDRARTWALVIGEMIELSLKNYVDQGLVDFNNYKGPTIRRKVGQLGIIANHGDGMFFKMKNSDLLAKFGFGSDTYHLIIQGDKHHFIAEQDTNSMKLVTSSVKSGGQYAEEVIYKDSVPGYLKITETKSGKAKVTMAMFDE